MDFAQGMNLFSGDNEFGKSTILSFIRAMFYGFSARSTLRMKDNDRRKFTPWNGKNFGGSIEFEHAGKTYLLEKTFSKRKADDRVSLTLLPSGQKLDPGQKEAGEYLFAISESEFVNTVFVGQLSSNIMTTEKETDDISARLANLADTGNELYSHEVIKSRLTGASSKLIALRGQGGIIPGIEEELANIDKQEKELELSEEQTELLRNEINTSLEKQLLTKGELLALSGRLDSLTQQGELLTAKVQEQEIILQTELQKQRMNRERAAAAAEMELVQREHSKQREEIHNQLSAEYTLAQEEVSRLLDRNRKERESAAVLSADAETLLKNQEIICRENKALYESKVQETQQLEEEILAVRSEIKTLIQMREDVRKGLTTIIAYKIQARRYVILFLAVFVFSMAAYAFMREPIQLAGILFLILAGVLFITNILERRIIEKKIVEKSMTHDAKLNVFENASAAQYDRQTALFDCEKYRDELLARKLRIKENEERDEFFRTQITDLAQTRLSESRERLARFNESSGEGQSDSPQDAPYKEIDGKPAVIPEHESGQEKSTGDNIDTAVLEQQIKEGRQQLLRIREDMSLITQQEEKLKSELIAGQVETARKETIRENLLSLATDRSWLLEQRTILNERLAEAKAYHRALQTAQNVLDEAFSEMENFFAPQVNEKAAGYLTRLTEGAYSTLHVDRSFSIDIASEGSYSFHKADFFSGGTVDQIYFALRLAIADLVQPSDDKMPLFLDDTFVQYDDKRAKAGLALLSELSLQRQIVLFTCHNRMSELYESIKDDKGSKCE